MICSMSASVCFEPGLKYGIDFSGGRQLEALKTAVLDIAPAAQRVDTAAAYGGGVEAEIGVKTVAYRNLRRVVKLLNTFLKTAKPHSIYKQQKVPEIPVFPVIYSPNTVIRFALCDNHRHTTVWS